MSYQKRHTFQLRGGMLICLTITSLLITLQTLYAAVLASSDLTIIIACRHWCLSIAGVGCREKGAFAHGVAPGFALVGSGAKDVSLAQCRSCAGKHVYREWHKLQCKEHAVNCYTSYTPTNTYPGVQEAFQGCATTIV